MERAREPGGDYEPPREPPGADRSDRADDADRAATRAKELQDSLPEGCRGRVTMAVGVGRDADNNERTVVGTSEHNGYLRPGVELKPGEELARGDKHAEVNVINHMRENGIDTRDASIAAGRPICGPCADEIDASGGRAASELKRR